MKPIIEQVFDAFKENREDVHLQWQIIDQLVASGKTDVLYELGRALANAHDEEAFAPMWAIESVYEYLEEVLATTLGMVYAQTLMNLFLFRVSRSWHVEKRIRRLAPLLARTQWIDILLNLIKEYQQNQACTEFLAVLVQEMVLHGISCDLFHLIGNFVDQLRALSHPLATLPLTLLPIEQLLPYISSRYAWEELERERRAFPSFQEEQLIIEENTATSEQESIRTAITCWNGGRSEVGIFAFNRAIMDVSENFLLALPLLSLKGMHSPHLSLRELSPRAACCFVFAAASRGGPYDSGYGGAYGRLATWRTLAGLAGVAESSSMKEIALVVEQCRWFDFTAQNDWFDVGPWQLGLLTLRPDRSSLVALATTAID
jgi:hypothetical protein